MDRFKMTDMRDVSRVLGINANRDRKKETIAIDQKGYTEDIFERSGAHKWLKSRLHTRSVTITFA